LTFTWTRYHPPVVGESARSATAPLAAASPERSPTHLRTRSDPPQTSPRGVVHRLFVWLKSGYTATEKKNGSDDFSSNPLMLLAPRPGLEPGTCGLTGQVRVRPGARKPKKRKEVSVGGAPHRPNLFRAPRVRRQTPTVRGGEVKQALTTRPTEPPPNSWRKRPTGSARSSACGHHEKVGCAADQRRPGLL
jgi:hypothetical protein